MLLSPAIEAMAFWILLRKPNVLRMNDAIQVAKETVPHDRSFTDVKEKIMYISQLFQYMLPLALVYLFEYFINQGLVSFKMH